MSFSSPKRNPNSKQQNPTHKPGPRRSRSVSSFPGTHLDITCGFHNTRDNPLFWSHGSDPNDHFEGLCVANGVGVGVGVGEGRRGRTASRNSGAGVVGVGVGVGGRRSLSTVYTGPRRRCRSPSLGPRSGNVESGRTQESSLLSNSRSNNKSGLNSNQGLLDDKNKLVRSASDLSEVRKVYNTWSSQHPAFETSDDSAIPHYNDPTSPGLIAEVEERTIKPVSEEREVIHWEGNNGTGAEILETVRTEVRRAISDMHKDMKDAMLSDCDVFNESMFSDVPPELADLSTVELVTDFREEFTRELEECEERTRKLRAELAVEEHRELELSKILSDMIPEPETPQAQKPRLIRKGSTERRKMSKCLEDEALAYFDECVSISTFDDSDFSSLEDPPSQKARVCETSYLPAVPGVPNITWSLESQDVTRQSSGINHNKASNLSTSCITNNTFRSSLDCSTRRPQFSFTSKLPDSTSGNQGIRNLVNSFTKKCGQQETSNSHAVRAPPRNMESYESEIPVERFLLNKLSFKSNIEYGGLSLCSGGIGFSRSPFSSNFC